MPVIDLRVSPRWVDHRDDLVILTLELENRSKVAVSKRSARIQCLEHTPVMGLLSEWVPFTESGIRTGEEPVEWSEPLAILATTQKIEPQAVLRVEFLYRYSAPPSLLHCAVQFVGNLNPITRVANRLGTGTDSWTTTLWVPRPTVAAVPDDNCSQGKGFAVAGRAGEGQTA
jgi:hypothetical protein